MANRFLDSMQHYVTADITKKYTSNRAATIVASSSPRNTPTLGFLNWNDLVTLTLDDQSTWVVGFRFKFNATTIAPTRVIWNLFDALANGFQLQLVIIPDNRLAIRSGNGSTILATAAGNALSSGVWYYIEWKSTIANSGGTSTIRLNNVEIASFTGDTQTTVNATASQHRIIDDLVGVLDGNICDIYIHDGTAGDNDFWGDTEIDYYIPDSNGATNDWTVTGAATNREAVDELAPSGSDYVSSATVNDLDLYNITNLTGSPTIKSVQAVAAALKDDGNPRTLALMARSNSVNYEGATQATPSTAAYLRQIWATDPDTLIAWTVSGLNAAQFGQKVKA